MSAPSPDARPADPQSRLRAAVWGLDPAAIEAALADGADALALDADLAASTGGLLHRLVQVWEIRDEHARMARPGSLEAGSGRDPGASREALAARLLASLRAVLLAQPGVSTRHRRGGRPVLHVLAEFGMPDAIALLVRHGAEVDARSTYGRTAAHVAALGDQVPALRRLVKLGANLEIRDQDQATPALLAARHAAVAALKELKRHGADMGVCDVHGKGVAVRLSHSSPQLASKWLAWEEKFDAARRARKMDRALQGPEGPPSRPSRRRM